ncbi:hypothetical protein KVR01_011657 [Diaporthe batatas]|uniref:uncharacterized protein n=1 Tax=Diaporthe batatas TaxID=748121 RepID=UPI001D057959|nr:uncharacterized protein KVR01_011657 [Diaporthe batatas]KAG8158535.1 hypothetical protein KVR01_011657 [Diaporthe batatas]
MAAVVLRAASIGSGSGAGDIDIVSIAEASTKLAEIACQEAEKLKEQARNDDNESSIRKHFLDNAISSIRTATFDQYNIVVCTDYEQDDFQDVQGQILLLRPIDVEVKKDVVVNCKIYIFDTGTYIRHGKREREDWSWWGESKIKSDPVSMQVYFENAQPKKNAEDINFLMSKGGDQNAGADANAAAKQVEEDAKAGNEDALKIEADQKAEGGHQTENKAKKEKQEDDAEELSDDVEEASDDVDEESDDVEEKGSEDEDAQSDDIEEK